MDELHPEYFSGLLPNEKPRPFDFIAGGNSPLLPKIVLPDGKWSNHDVSSDRQSIPGVIDSMNCTGFAAARVIGNWLRLLIDQGKISATATPDHWKFLTETGILRADGSIRVSPRFIGFVAGTGSNGNYLTAVLDAVRKWGFCSDQTWAWDRALQKTYATYFSKPSDQAYTEAEKSKELFELAYEWFINNPTSYKDALKEAALYAALCTCGGWSTDDPVKWCNVTVMNHCIVILDEDLVSPPAIGDSFPDYIKHLAMDYQIPYALKTYLNIKKNLTMTKKFRVQDGDKLGIMIEEGFTATVLFADSMDHYKALCDAYGINDQTPLITLTR